MESVLVRYASFFKSTSYFQIRGSLVLVFYVQEQKMQFMSSGTAHSVCPVDRLVLIWHLYLLSERD